MAHAPGAIAVLRKLFYLGLAVGLLAVVVPSYMRARSTPGVQGGLGDVQSLVAAERSYATANGGYFDVPACLGAPARCIPGAGADLPAFVDERTATLQPRDGYQFRFTSGSPPALKDEERSNVSRSSLDSFAVAAIPIPGSGQRRSFCGDSRGVICARADGTMPPAHGGRCPEDCEVLR